MAKTKPVVADMTIEEFCRRHNACSDGREWAEENCATMQDVWRKAPVYYLVWVATRKGVLTESTARILAVSYVFPIRRYLLPGGRKALRIALKHARGKATYAQLQEANESAMPSPRRDGIDFVADHMAQMCTHREPEVWIDNVLFISLDVLASLAARHRGGGETTRMSLRDKLFPLYVERLRTHGKPNFRPCLEHYE